MTVKGTFLMRMTLPMGSSFSNRFVLTSAPRTQTLAPDLTMASSKYMPSSTSQLRTSG